MIRYIVIFVIVLTFWVSGGVAAEQTEPGEQGPALSKQKLDAPKLKETRVPSGKQKKEREWEKVEKELLQLESVIEEKMRAVRQATRECETKNKGDKNAGEALDGKEISRQLEGYSQRLRECVDLKEGCEEAIAGFSDLSQKLQFELQEANNEYSRCMKAVMNSMSKDSETKDNIIGNFK